MYLCVRVRVCVRVCVCACVCVCVNNIFCLVYYCLIDKHPQMLSYICKSCWHIAKALPTPDESLNYTVYVCLSFSLFNMQRFGMHARLWPTSRGASHTHKHIDKLSWTPHLLMLHDHDKSTNSAASGHHLFNVSYSSICLLCIRSSTWTDVVRCNNIPNCLHMHRNVTYSCAGMWLVVEIC